MAWQDEHKFSNYELIEHLPNGQVIVVSNDLTSTTWKGALYTYESSKDLLEDNHKHIENQKSGISCLLAWDSDLIVGLDNGQIRVFETGNNNLENNCHKDIYTLLGHDSYVTALTLSKDHTRLISGSADTTIVNWDLHASLAINTYRSFQNLKSLAHSECDDVFLSCSDTNEVNLWDIRLPRPAKKLKNNIKECITTAAWIPNSEHSYVLGSETGSLFLKDLRNADVEDSFPIMKKEIHTLRFNTKEPNLLAIASYDTSVIVFDINSKEIAYKEDLHEHFVGGLSWDPKENNLYSCGWDKKILKHTI